MLLCVAFLLPVCVAFLLPVWVALLLKLTELAKLVSMLCLRSRWPVLLDAQPPPPSLSSYHTSRATVQCSPQLT